MLKPEQIARNISWLVANGSPSVRYLTHRHLLKRTRRSKELRQLWESVQASDEVAEIFASQESDGSWCSANPWARRPYYIPSAGYSPFTPKYVTTVWVLSVLGDMGFTVEDPRIGKAKEYVLGFQWPSGQFSRFNVKGSPTGSHGDAKAEATEDSFRKFGALPPCELGIYLTALGKVGMGRDRRLRKSYDLLVRMQEEDGGWITPLHKEERGWWRSCPQSSHGGAMALYYSRCPRYRDALRRGLQFLVWHLSIKRPDEICQPYYHGHNTVKETLAFSELAVGLDESPVQAQLKWLASMYRPSEAQFSFPGKRPTKSSHGRIRYQLHHVLEDDWLTYYGTRIAVNLNSAQGAASDDADKPHR